MRTLEAPRRQLYQKELLVQYLEGQSNMPIVVIAKGLGIPGKEIGWMFLLNHLGFNVAYAPYRGTWLSEGQFLPNSEGELSVTKDITDLVDSATEIFGRREVYVIADCFGASPALVAAAKREEVSKVATYGAMIYNSDPELNRKYWMTGDKSIKLGENLDRAMKDGGEFFDGYNGFNISVWRQMIDGRTGLNPYNFLQKLASKRILALHPRNDSLIDYERSADFVNALKRYCSDNGLAAFVSLSTIEEGGHGAGFGPKQKEEVIMFLAGDRAAEIAPRMDEAAALEEAHKGKAVRQDGKEFSVPFHELVARQIDDFRKAGLLKDNPLEVILNEIFRSNS